MEAPSTHEADLRNHSVDIKVPGTSCNFYSDTKDKAMMTPNTAQMDCATDEQDIQDAAAYLAAVEEDNW